MSDNAAWLRQTVKARRQSLSTAERHRASEWLINHLATQKVLQKAAVIALYQPHRGEIDPCGLMALWPDKTWVFPRVVSPADGHMHFYAAPEPADWVRGVYGILEPPATTLIRDADIEVVITPLVAFDARGNRLGAGGGYYDRFFARWPHIHRLGVAYAFQQYPIVPVRSWDQPLHQVVTEAGQVALKNES